MPNTSLIVDSRRWRIVQYLSDGDWHNISQIATMLGTSIRAEIAHRRYVSVTGAKAPRPMTDETILRGCCYVATEDIDGLRKQGYLVEQRGQRGHRDYRLGASHLKVSAESELALALPELTPPEYASLKGDIAQRGLVYPIVVDETGAVIDGRNRLRAWTELVSDGKLTGECPRIAMRGLTPDQKAELTLALNLYRRHIGAVQRRHLVAWLRAQGWSYRKIAKAAGVSHETVWREASSPSSTVTNVTHHDGEPTSPEPVSPTSTPDPKPSEKPAPKPAKHANAPAPKSPDGPAPPQEHKAPSQEPMAPAEPTAPSEPSPERTVSLTLPLDPERAARILARHFDVVKLIEYLAPLATPEG